uniref:Uncharacterized protein n=1 Tax=Mycena chlorophos TaxID=658473 RepID=A0ABQ0KZK6_MYCCL|nr:predicted protein [Mycena chlorophos]
MGSSQETTVTTVSLSHSTTPRSDPPAVVSAATENDPTGALLDVLTRAVCTDSTSSPVISRPHCLRANAMRVCRNSHKTALSSSALRDDDDLSRFATHARPTPTKRGNTSVSTDSSPDGSLFVRRTRHYQPIHFCHARPANTREQLHARHAQARRSFPRNVGLHSSGEQTPLKRVKSLTHFTQTQSAPAITRDERAQLVPPTAKLDSRRQSLSSAILGTTRLPEIASASASGRICKSAPTVSVVMHHWDKRRTRPHRSYPSTTGSPAPNTANASPGQRQRRFLQPDDVGDLTEQYQISAPDAANEAFRSFLPTSRAEWCQSVQSSLFRQAELPTTRSDTVSGRDDTNGQRPNAPRIKSSTLSRPIPKARESILQT